MCPFGGELPPHVPPPPHCLHSGGTGWRGGSPESEPLPQQLNKNKGKHRGACRPVPQAMARHIEEQRHPRLASATCASHTRGPETTKRAPGGVRGVGQLALAVWRGHTRRARAHQCLAGCASVLDQGQTLGPQHADSLRRYMECSAKTGHGVQEPGGACALRARPRRSPVPRSARWSRCFALTRDTARAACHVALCPSKAVFEHVIALVLATKKRAAWGCSKALSPAEDTQ